MPLWWAAERPSGCRRRAAIDDYCVRQHQYTSALTLESPQVRAWIEFFENNDGTLPDCPVPLGDASGTCDLMSVQLMDERQTAAIRIRLHSGGRSFQRWRVCVRRPRRA